MLPERWVAHTEGLRLPTFYGIIYSLALFHAEELVGFYWRKDGDVIITNLAGEVEQRHRVQ